jgi:hypothetical protein
MKKVIFLFMLLISTQQTLFSQEKKALLNPNVGNAIERFNNTEFMVKFMDLKNQIEGEAVDFIKTQNKYPSSDVRSVQSAYSKTAARFNQVMLDIKQSFLDKKRVKMINEFPVMYANSISNEMDKLERFYKENFNLTVKELTQKNGSAILALIIELVKSAGELSNYFKGIKYEKQAMNEDYIQKNLIEPSKFKSWNELSSGVKIDPASDDSQKQNEQKNEDKDKNKDKDKDKDTDKPEGDSNKDNKKEKKKSQIDLDDNSKTEEQQPIQINKIAKKKNNN